MHISRRALIAAFGAAALVATTIPAFAGGAEVTEGSFAAFAGGVGSYDDVEGTAHMVRTASGRTIVSVNLRGLTPGETYGSHVHNQACDDGDAGGHYSFGYPVPGGAHPSASEIWPGPFVANAAGNAKGHTAVGDTAGPEAVSVVVHASNGTKIACADLA